MTTYFAAPDSAGEPTLWTGDPARPTPVMRCTDLGPGMDDHWDEIVRRVVAGNLTATQRWALDKATVVVTPNGIMQTMPTNWEARGET